MKIIWVEVNHIKSGQGHGVEFYHDDFGGIQSHKPIAFLEGYDWYHCKSKNKVNPIKIQILKPDSEMFHNTSQRSGIVKEIKDVITLFLSKPNLQKAGQITDKIYAWYNA